MGTEEWRGVDVGWGRRATEFAALSEPGNCREYVALHQALGVQSGDHLLDIACGAGLALELAAARGATCAGLDASERLVAVARDRSPEADIHVGDMHALPWQDASFDVVTSFRGIWGTTPDALTEALRVLRPGGRLGLTVWGHIKASSGAWALAPFTLASEPKVVNQAAMVALGRPGAGERLLADYGFVDVERIEIPFAWEFADPESYARALAATGPAYEAIETVGEEAFLAHAVDRARRQVREGLPLRAEIKVVGYLARKPVPVRSESSPPVGVGFLGPAPPSEAAERLYAEDRADPGYVMNVSRLWAHDPDARERLFALTTHVTRRGDLSLRHRSVLVTAMASALGDSYCALAWGKKLAEVADPGLAARVLRGDDGELDDQEAALARWARRVVRAPNDTAAADVEALRTVGFDDRQIFAVTLFVALRLAFSTVNDALGACPDPRLVTEVPAPVRDTVTFGRSPSGSWAVG